MIQTLWILGILLRAGESVMRMAWVHWLPEAPCPKFVSRIWVMPLINQTVSSQCLRPSMLICCSSGEKCFLDWKQKGQEEQPHLILLIHLNVFLFVFMLFHNLNPFSLGFCFPALGIFVVAQLLSHFWLFLNLWTAACQASLSFVTSWSWFKISKSSYVYLTSVFLHTCLVLIL